MEKMNYTIPLPSGMKFDFEKVRASLLDPEASLRNKIETYNSTPGHLKGYDCPKCKNRGDIMVLTEDKRMEIRPCSCCHIRKAISCMEASGLDGDLKKYRFEGFIVTESWQQQMLDLAKRYAEKPERWVLFSGQSGCGKTYLCTCIAKAILYQEKPLQYLSWVRELRDLKNYENYKQRDEKLERFQNVEYLYIDDFLKVPGGMKPNAAELQIAFTLIDSRYRRKKPTILSTELEPGEITALDEALGSRIMEMVGDRNVVVKRQKGRNYRLKALRDG